MENDRLTIARIDEDIATVGKYRDALLRLQSVSDLTKERVLRERLRELHRKVVEFYYTYQPILNLSYEVKELSWIHLSPGIRHKYPHNPIGPVSEFYNSLVGLKNRKTWQLEQSTETLITPPEVETPPVPVNTFNKKGGVWEIAYKGKGPFYLPDDYKGLHYIYHVLYNPGKKYPVLDLVREVEGNIPPDKAGPYNKMSEEELEQEGLSLSSWGGGEVVMDEHYKSQIKRAIKELDQKIEEARENHDIDTADELQKEKEGLEKALSSGAGLANKPRRFSDTKETERKRVSFLINTALNAIKNCDENLYQHLDESIKRGTEVYYIPKEPTTWK